MICRRKGYPLRVVMPDNVTEERTQLLRMYGAEIVYSEGAKGSNGAVELALEMAEADSSVYMPYQYGNPANPGAHYNGTAVEILDELDDVAAFVGGLGTGGTLMGVGRRLKENDPETKIVAAEPMQGELVQGLRSLDDGFIPPIIDLSVLDRKIMVSNRDAIVWTQRLLRRGGPLRRRLGRRGRLRLRADRRRARGGERRLPRARRRLEVPLVGRLHDAGRRARGARLHRLVVTRPGESASLGPWSRFAPRASITWRSRSRTSRARAGSTWTCSASSPSSRRGTSRRSCSATAPGWRCSRGASYPGTGAEGVPDVRVMHIAFRVARERVRPRAGGAPVARYRPALRGSRVSALDLLPRPGRPPDRADHGRGLNGSGSARARRRASP